MQQKYFNLLNKYCIEILTLEQIDAIFSCLLARLRVKVFMFLVPLFYFITNVTVKFIVNTPFKIFKLKGCKLKVKIYL